MIRTNRYYSAKSKPKDQYETLYRLHQSIINGDLFSFSSFDPDHVKNLRMTNYKRNALHLAVWYNQPQIVKKICKDEALKSLVQSQDNNGDTPLHLAVFVKNFEAYLILIQSGASITALNNQKERPLEVIYDPQLRKDFLSRVSALSNQQNELLVPNTNASTIVSKSPTVQLESPTLINPQKNENQTSIFLLNPHNTKSAFLNQSASFGEDLLDLDHDLLMGGEFSSIVHSKISKSPKMLSQIQFVSIQDNDFSRPRPRNHGSRGHKRYGTTLVTRIPTDTMYYVNKISPKEDVELEDLIQEIGTNR